MILIWGFFLTHFEVISLIKIRTYIDPVHLLPKFWLYSRLILTSKVKVMNYNRKKLWWQSLTSHEFQSSLKLPTTSIQNINAKKKQNTEKQWLQCTCKNHSISCNSIEERRELPSIYSNCSRCGWLSPKCRRMGKEDGVKKM